MMSSYLKMKNYKNILKKYKNYKIAKNIYIYKKLLKFQIFNKFKHPTNIAL